MRVLLTTDTIGGVWTFTKELAEQLLQTQHSVSLVSFGKSPSALQAAWCAALLEANPLRFSYEPSDVPLEWMAKNESAYLEGSRILIDLARRTSPDLLHTSQYCFAVLPLDIPKVVTAHSDVLSWAESCRPEGLEPSEWLNTYMQLVQAGLQSADVLVAPTKWMLTTLSRYFIIPGRTEVIYNGRTLLNSSSLQKAVLRCVSAGRLWDEAKGLRSLLSAALPIPTVIAGERSFVATSIESNSKVVEFSGYLAEEELLKLFRASTIYIAASIYEPFGLAPLEAALCGCAIVARDLPSLREVWSDAATYFQNTADLESILSKFAGDPVSLESARSASHHHAGHFSGERMAGSYLALYKDLLKGHISHLGTSY